MEQLVGELTVADKENNNRTHEPSLRELTAELDGIAAVFEEKIAHVSSVMDEREQRYQERFKAMDEKTSLALISSKEAVSKAEAATEKRFESVNEFRTTLSDQAAGFLPRPEFASQHRALEQKIDTFKEALNKELATVKDSLSREIQGLRESRSEGRGEKQQSVYMLGIGLVVMEILMSLIVAVLLHYWK